MSYVTAEHVAAIVAGVKALATAFAGGAAKEGGVAGWKKLQQLFGWGDGATSETVPTPEKIEADVTSKIESDPTLAKEAVVTLQAAKEPSEERPAWGQLVGHIDAEKVVVANKIDTVNM